MDARGAFGVGASGASGAFGAGALRVSVLRVPALAVGLAVGVTLLLVAFVWPTVASSPKDVPIAVAPPAAAAQVGAGMARIAPPGALHLVPVADEAAAVAAIPERRVYGAIVVGPTGPRVLSAGAASPVVAQMLDAMARGIAAAGTDRPVAGATDVVPPPAADPHGAGFAVGAIPMTIAGLIAGAVIGMALRRRAARLAGLILTAVLVGLAFGVVLHLLGVLGGSYPAEAAAIALAALAVAAVVCGAVAVFGARGVAPVAVVMVLLGVPLSGAMSPPEFLPDFWGALGQWLPTGAGVGLLKSVSFFPAAGLGAAPWILLGWSILGLAGVLAGRRREVGAPTRPDDGARDRRGDLGGPLVSQRIEPAPS